VRAGWSLGDVLGRYFRYDAPMDSFLGRLLAGLDVNSPAFATMPPRFASVVDDALIWRCFPAFQKRSGFLGVLRFVLPSLVHHHSQLARMLPKRHRLHSSVLFMDSQLRQALSTTVSESMALKATGVPPHVTVLRQGASIESKIDRLTSHLLTGTRPDVTEDEVLEVVQAAAPSSVGFPDDFEFPSVGPLTAWRLLLHGDKENGLPPFCSLTAKDFRGKRSMQKRLSEWMVFYHAVRAQMVDDDEDGNDEEQQFLNAWRKFDFTQSKLTTRPDQWKLSTVVLKLREMKATAKAQPPSADVAELLQIVRPRQPPPPPLEKVKSTTDYKLFF